MPFVTLPAHFDGERICLDEPFDLKTDTKLIVTILPNQEPDNEHKSWLFLSGQRLEEAYGANEPEYSSKALEEFEDLKELRKEKERSKNEPTTPLNEVTRGLGLY